MVKTYSFLSGFVLRIIIGNLLVTPLLVLTGTLGIMLAPLLITLTFFLGVLWVVLKLLQAHFPDKTVEISYTETTRRKQKIGMFVSLAVCVILIAVSVLMVSGQSSSPVSLPFLPNVQLPNIFSSLTILPLAVIILLVNGYVGWFYRLAGQRRLPPSEPKQEDNSQQ